WTKGSRYFVALLMGIIITAHKPVRQKWTRKMYEEHDYKSFAKLPMANQVIDFNDIDYALLNAAIFYATNWQRDKHYQKPLRYSAALEKAAFEHSKDMVQHNFFSHTSPIKGRETHDKRIRAAGVSGGYMGENIAYHSHVTNTYLNQAKKIVAGWMNSPGHRQNILSSHYQYLGCGAYVGKYSTVATQNFSDRDAPASKEIVIDYR
ncbi:MAG: CAP domain-containing protein, partial [Cytophagales bacterium]|nr:CAP domain-containing protein [Cytophagales bacterium]